MKKTIGIALVITGLILFFGLGMNYGFFMRNRQQTIANDTMIRPTSQPAEYVYTRLMLRSCVIKLNSLQGGEK